MSRYKLFEKSEEPVLFNLGITGLRMALLFKNKKKKKREGGGGRGRRNWGREGERIRLEEITCTGKAEPKECYQCLLERLV